MPCEAHCCSHHLMEATMLLGPLVRAAASSLSQSWPDASSSAGSRIEQEVCPAACLDREVGGWVCGRRLEQLGVGVPLLHLGDQQQGLQHAVHVAAVAQILQAHIPARDPGVTHMSATAEAEVVPEAARAGIESTGHRAAQS